MTKFYPLPEVLAEIARDKEIERREEQRRVEDEEYESDWKREQDSGARP